MSREQFFFLYFCMGLIKEYLMSHYYLDAIPITTYDPVQCWSKLYALRQTIIVGAYLSKKHIFKEKMYKI